MTFPNLCNLRKAARAVFAAACVLAPLVQVPAPLYGQQVAITFDDLPVHGPLPPGVTRVQVIEQLLAALKASGTPPVYGFVNGVHLDGRPAGSDLPQALKLWREAGYPLGNHTWSHMNLNDHTAAEWEADLLRNEPVLEPLMRGADWRWVRFPYLAEGDSPAKTVEVRSVLADHHYRIAGVTLSFGDYLFNEPYARCKAAGNEAGVQVLERSYLQAASDDLSDRRQMAQAVFGHDIPYILLMHVGAFDAYMLPRLLAQYKAAGVQWIGLEQAERDPFYRNDLNPTLPSRPDTLEAALADRHLPVLQHSVDAKALDALCR